MKEEKKFETLDEYLDSLIPEKCKGCECAHLEIENGDWVFRCELEKCYLEEK